MGVGGGGGGGKGAGRKQREEEVAPLRARRAAARGARAETTCAGAMGGIHLRCKQTGEARVGRLMCQPCVSARKGRFSNPQKLLPMGQRKCGGARTKKTHAGALVCQLLRRAYIAQRITCACA